MFSLAIFGANKVDGSTVEPGEAVTALALFGDIEVDFAATPPPPDAEVVMIAIFGGATLKVRPEQDVRVTGFSLFGDRRVDPRRQLEPSAGFRAAPEAPDDEDVDFPLEVSGYAIFGGVSVKREETETGRRLIGEERAHCKPMGG